MSNTENTVSHNVYFEGKVQSLGLNTANGKATLGVMKAGAYTFSTATPEKMIVITGILNVKLPDTDWIAYTDQQAFDVPAGIAFEVKCDSDVSYICYYG